MSGGSARSTLKKALEQQIRARRIDRGDAERVTDRAVGGAAAALTQDFARARHLDDLARAQEIRRDLHALDHRQLFLDLLAHAAPARPRGKRCAQALLRSARRSFSSALSPGSSVHGNWYLSSVSENASRSPTSSARSTHSG